MEIFKLSSRYITSNSSTGRFGILPEKRDLNLSLEHISRVILTIIPEYIDAQAALLVFDVTRQTSLEALDYWVQELRNHDPDISTISI